VTNNKATDAEAVDMRLDKGQMVRQSDRTSGSSNVDKKTYKWILTRMYARITLTEIPPKTDTRQWKNNDK